MSDHRKLEVWHLACAQADRCDAAVAYLPQRVQKNLGDQLARSSESIHLLLAEGCGLNSDRQLIAFVRRALGSANEVEDCLTRLMKRQLLKPADHDLLANAVTVRKKLGALLQTLRRDQGDDRRR
ncbi:MAG TPA: four helix bundle protein [Gemmatimonadaceae bacterium]|jgi:four helix bundle protein|nr:four helix bundle protein [Gemmatimonadaceae bacterium]